MRRNKYNVGPKEARTFRGVVYASKAEALRASELESLYRCGHIRPWDRQCVVVLGDISTVVDFFVRRRNGERWYEEVKGYETPRFRLVRRLWKKYGPYQLRIMKRHRGGWKVETIEAPTAAG